MDIEVTSKDVVKRVSITMELTNEEAHKILYSLRSFDMFCRRSVSEIPKELVKLMDTIEKALNVR